MSSTSEPRADSPRGCLSLVATPIGNLEDMSERCIRTLHEAAVIAAEDTRRTKNLLRHFGIDTPLRSFHAHSDEAACKSLVDRVANGEHVAYVTDAGTPSVSDPGALLVRACQDRDLDVDMIPGPSALSTAIAICGIVAPGFTFYGFIPRGGSGRDVVMGEIARSRLASVFFESPERVSQTIADLADIAEPEREVTLCRELTKRFQEVRRAPLAQWIGTKINARGEFTVVVGGRSAEATAANAPAFDLSARARDLVDQGMRSKDASKRLAFEAGISRRDAYDAILEASRLKNDSD